MKTTLSNLRTGFSPVFWVANIVELFERLAFFGSKAVLAFYLANTIGLDLATTGWLLGMFAGLIWSLPVLAGVVVDRFGFRAALLACFAIFALGYFSVGLAGMPEGKPLVDALGKTGFVAAALILTAIGGSLIKPSVVGTVERTAMPEFRALGFSIYYALVNLGGAIGPILASELRTRFGFEWVFVMSAAVSAAMFFGVLLFFKEPPLPEGIALQQRSFGKLFRDMGLVFRNFRFVSFLVIFSGFWIMFWQVFYSLPFYVDKVLQFPRFEIIETVDAWTIIVLSVPLTALSRKTSAMNAMIIGFAIASCSWFFLAASQTIWATVVGMGVFAVGESLQSPRFYEYVGSLAPKDQVGTYMGFAFLPIAIGSFIAGRLATWLVEHYLNQPATMWLIVAAIGFVTGALLFVHSKVFQARPLTSPN